ncbi:MAG: hypothetical protein L6R38_006615 [Xanthoria sp. 2 TBL-2021]|nr:MAG: hypothetical protein L6R38_006615 [Xanthoria sp. 2 TBL-2021]
MNQRIEKLITSKDTTKVAKYFHVMDDLDSIRRSTTASLNKNESGEKISLKSMMPPHKVRTVELQYEEDEAAEVEWFGQVHRDDGGFCRPKNLVGKPSLQVQPERSPVVQSGHSSSIRLPCSTHCRMNNENSSTRVTLIGRMPWLHHIAIRSDARGWRKSAKIAEPEFTRTATSVYIKVE